MTAFRPYIVITSALLFLCCVVYPAFVTAAAQVLFRDKANGSLLERGNKLVGSSLIGQSIQDWKAHPEYFWGRPSGASNDASTGITYSSGSNYGPSSAALISEVQDRVKLLRDSGVVGAVPVDLVTKSASGLDPHISPAAAELQIPRIARARHLSDSELQNAVNAHTESSTWGLLGEPRVNVLLLNLDLDARAPVSTPGAAQSP